MKREPNPGFQNEEQEWYHCATASYVVKVKKKYQFNCNYCCVYRHCTHAFWCQLGKNSLECFVIEAKSM